MSDARSQLAEVDALLAAAPDDPAMQQLRDDLLQLIALEEQEQLMVGGAAAQPSSAAPLEPDSEPSLSTTNNSYTAQGAFLEHSITSNSAGIAEAPDLGSFQPVVRNAAKSPPVLKSGDEDTTRVGNTKDSSTATNTNATTAPLSTEKKTKKKKKAAADDVDAVLDAQFELPTHLVPLESDTPAQRLKKQRTAKALKSKFREKQKEAEHAKRQNDWKSFATKAVGKKRKGHGIVGSSSIFSTEDGVNARVGVISGGGGRTMTNFADPNKRHK